ncbi:GIY-YIG nuclease family protein [Jatrophihabitans fulvus]
MTISGRSDTHVPLEWLVRALEEFAVRDADLLTLGAGETALSARLAHHLTRVVPEYWDVDAEYDRQNEDWAKKVRRPGTKGARGTHMRPDIAVHLRGASGPDNNLMMIEVKRKWRAPGDPDDLEKAHAAINLIGYQFTVVLGLSLHTPAKALHEEHRFQPHWTVLRRPLAAAFDPHIEPPVPEVIYDGRPIFAADRLVELRAKAEMARDARRRLEPLSAHPATTHVDHAVDASARQVRVNHKWGFGMSPVKPATARRRVVAAQRVLELVAAPNAAANGQLDELISDLSELKGLFNRVARQDQWDWFTVWLQLGTPGRRQAIKSATALADLREALIRYDPDRARRARDALVDSGGALAIDALTKGGHPAPDVGIGYVYVLSTRRDPKMLKIGYTERPIADRVNEINRGTGVPIPFGARAAWKVRRAPEAEREIHALLGEWRVRADREFFDMDFRDAHRVIDRMVEQHLEEV